MTTFQFLSLVISSVLAGVLFAIRDNRRRIKFYDGYNQARKHRSNLKLALIAGYGVDVANNCIVGILPPFYIAAEAYRKRKKLSYKQMADKLNISHGSYGNYIKEGYVPSSYQFKQANKTLQFLWTVEAQNTLRTYNS